MHGYEITTCIHEDCCWTAARWGADLLLTGSNALFCGSTPFKLWSHIGHLINENIATKVIPHQVGLEDMVSTITTRTPVFLLSDTLAVDALQKMVLTIKVGNIYTSMSPPPISIYMTVWGYILLVCGLRKQLNVYR